MTNGRGWIPGWMIDIKDHCKAVKNEGATACTDYASTLGDTGTLYNDTKMLREGEYCEVFVDASAEIAHVYFVDSTEIGVLYNQYVLGEGIEIEKGNK
mgnify:CR=1 FL=1